MKRRFDVRLVEAWTRRDVGGCWYGKYVRNGCFQRATRRPGRRAALLTIGRWKAEARDAWLRVNSGSALVTTGTVQVLGISIQVPYLPCALRPALQHETGRHKTVTVPELTQSREYSGGGSCNAGPSSSGSCIVESAGCDEEETGDNESSADMTVLRYVAFSFAKPVLPEALVPAAELVTTDNLAGGSDVTGVLANTAGSTLPATISCRACRSLRRVRACKT